MRKLVLPLSFLFATSVWADEGTDRVAIEKAITALNGFVSDPGARLRSGLFTSDADGVDFDRLVNIHRSLLDDSKEPWSEVRPPRIISKAIRFLTPDVAVVDGADAQSGSFMRSIPLLFVMKKQGMNWRIATLRLLVEASGSI
jgi:hypothetical protein